MNTAIIVAAGSGSRFGGNTPKQFLEIDGKPRDFQYAWRNHWKAWNKQPAYARSFETSERFDEAYTVGNDNGREIDQTWYQVLRIAQRYGVRIDRSYYQ